ncbi:MAG TPA: hypothetical protein EYP10_13635, partial [Armatimonadetes bacterium]|nr:hypothetical protein [Armatimonadota bacterium]
MSGLMLAWGLAACGEEVEVAPQLAAPPTRTPQPPTPTLSVEDRLENVAIVFLADPIAAYLDAAEGRSPIDRPEIFHDAVIAAVPDCFASTYHPGVEPLELLQFNPVSVDNEAWRAVLDASPREAMEAALRDTLATVITALPVDHPLRLCVVPVPVPHPQDVPEAEAPAGIHGAEALSPDLLILWCSGGDSCTEFLATDLAYAYYYAVQIGYTGLIYPDVPLLYFMLYAARAAEFSRALFPDAVYPWDGFALLPEQEATLWAAMQPHLRVTYSERIESRKIDRFLNGRENSPDYPLWGGMIVAENILRAYRARHPDISWAELA